MKKKELLIGKAVRIPLSLTVDPIGKQSSFGVIMGADREGDKITVHFEDGDVGNYMFDSLETLNPDKAMLYGLSLRGRVLEHNDFQTMRKVITLSLQGKQMEALKLAYSNSTVEQYCIVRTDQYYEMKVSLKKYVGVSKKR